MFSNANALLKRHAVIIRRPNIHSLFRVFSLMAALVFVAVSAFAQEQSSEHQASSSYALHCQSDYSLEKIDPTILLAEDALTMRNHLNDINGDILVNENEIKTWKVYTGPILKRKDLYLAKNSEQKIIAYASMKNEGPYLSWIAVKKEYRGKEHGQVAKQLVQKILADYPQFSLDVRQTNARAVTFYRSLSDVADVIVDEGHTYVNGDKGFLITVKRKAEK